MTDFIARWRDEHVRFAKLLDVLEAQLDRFHRGERPDYQLMFDVVQYMSSYADRFHHPPEDLAFAVVAEHDPQTRAPIGDLIAEHAVIRADGEKLVGLLEGALDDVILSRREVEEPGRDYIARLRRHIRREELLFPFVAKWLKARDWAEIRRKTALDPDPAIAARMHDRHATLQRLVAAWDESKPAVSA